MPSDLVRDLKRRETRRADIKPARVVGPAGTGRLWKMTYPGDTTVWVAKAAVNLSLRPGQIVPTGSNLGGPGRVILQDSAPGQIGTASHAYQPKPSLDLDSLLPRVHRLIPDTFTPGATDVPVIAEGVNLSATSILVFVHFSREERGNVADPFLTAHSQLAISSERVDLLVDVAENAPPGYVADLGVQ